jgi:hypothetical protein
LEVPLLFVKAANDDCSKRCSGIAKKNNISYTTSLNIDSISHIQQKTPAQAFYTRQRLS